MGHLLPYVKQQFFDSDGEPLSGGKIYFYRAGTTTQFATYTDESETTPNANPVILDANGEASIWIGSGAYKCVIADSDDVVLKTVDFISHISPGYIDTEMLADESIKTEKLEDNVLSADTAGHSKMQDGYLSADAEGRAKMASGYITRPKLEALGQQVSSSSGAFSHAGTGSAVDVTNLTVSLTTTGRPVRLELSPDGGTGGVVSLLAAAADSALAEVYILEGATLIATFPIFIEADGATDVRVDYPPSIFSYLHVTAAGSKSYKIQVSAPAGTTVNFTTCKLVAYELF